MPTWQQHYDAGEPLDEVLDGFVENVQALAEFLRALPARSMVTRITSCHVGEWLTLQTWVERDLAHIEEHLETVKEKRRISK